MGESRAFAFGPFILAPERRELRDGSGTVDIGSRALDILTTLVTRYPTIVTKGELMRAVWPDRTVEHNNLTVHMAALRRVLGDGRDGARFVQTLHGRGYCFVAPVTDTGPEPVTVPALPALPDKPSIAVLPFQGMSGGVEQEYFADGVVEEITTALSRIRWLFVIARNSSFTYKGQAVDIRRVGRELGVRYVLEGSVRAGGDRVRITAQLIEAETGSHLWADHFDGALEDIFELPDRVAISVAGVIEPALEAAEVSRAAQRPTHDLTAYDLYLRAAALHRSFTREGIYGALTLLNQAIVRDPDYGPALVRAAICHERLRHDGWSADPEADQRQAIELARRAVRVSPEDPGVLSDAAFVLSFSADEDMAGILQMIDRALALNPGFARGWYTSAIIFARAGYPDESIERANRALRLSPRERSGPFLIALGYAHFIKRDFAAAIADLTALIHEYPNFIEGYRQLAACYAHHGQLAQARATIERLRSMTSAILPPHVATVRRAEDRELYLSGLRLAMGESESREEATAISGDA
ncbi:MAG TPA: winged helix-turn-helix domain-containing protein [Stellaceae bacterium]|jgi:adenylate cyclase|nr:winged helix-turn-helix domain-containing protein [Stellaceae bacterium]